MNSMTLLKALNNIDDKYIQEESEGKEKAADNSRLKKINIVRYVPWLAAIAAVAAVFITVNIQKDAFAPSDEEAVTVVSPYVYYETLEEAEKAAGFEIAVPEIIDNEKISEIIVIAEDTIEIGFGTDQESVVTIRKAKGSEDISGNYNTYGFEKELSFDGISVKAKGDDDLIKLLTWQNGEFTYSLSSPEGMPEEQAMEIITMIE